MKIRYITLSIILLFFLSACGQPDKETSNSDQIDSLIPIKVEWLLEEQFDVGTVTLSVQVTHNNEVVNDAHEVLFEVWEEGQKELSEMLEGKLSDDGIYEADYTFESEGIYFVVPHVTARDKHIMEQHQLVIGDIEVNESDSNDHHEHHHYESISLTFSYNDNVLSTEILYEDALLTNANITFEVWQDGDEDQRYWITAEEIEAGIYQAEFSESSSGLHHVIIHIENEELHEHIHQSFEY